MAGGCTNGKQFLTGSRSIRKCPRRAVCGRQGMLSLGQSVQGVMVRGIDPARESGITELSDKMKAGALSDLRGGNSPSCSEQTWRVPWG